MINSKDNIYIISYKYFKIKNKLMNIYFRLTFLTCLIVNLSSCGHEKIEDDKYPNLPYFPKTNDTKIKFQKINFNPTGFYRLDDTYFKIANSESYPKDLHIFYYKKDLITKTDSILLKEGFNFIDESGFLYNSVYETNIDKYDINHEVTKINIKTGERKKIEYHKYNYGKEYQNIFDLNKEYEKQLTHLPDSLIKHVRFNRIDSVESEIRKKFKTNIIKGLQKTTKIGLNSRDNSYLLQYKNKEIIVKEVPYMNNDTKDDEGLIGLLESYTQYNNLKPIILEKTTDLNIFDHAVRGNHLGGGKFNFSLYQSGIQYYELNFKNEKALFKLQTKYLPNHNLLQTFLMPDKKTIILYSYTEQFKLSL